MCRLIGATLLLVSSAALAGPQLAGGGGHGAGGMSHAPTRAAAVIAPSLQPQYARDNHVVRHDPSVNRMCTAQQRSGNKCLDRGWNVTVPPSGRTVTRP